MRLLQWRRMLMKTVLVLVLVKVLGIDHWMGGEELMLEQLSSERELLDGESLSL